ncbi:MAG: S8 family serine peptidase [Erythrobacter sp.]|nr:S8 family serine peptidase [Erythrobacter sp.]
MKTRPFLAALAAIAVLSGCQAARLNPPVDAEIAADADFVVDETEIVVVTPSQTEARNLMRRAAPLGYEMIANDRLDALGLRMLTVRIPANQDGASAIRELESLEPGVTAGVNHAYVPQRQSSSGAAALEYAPDLMRWSPGGCSAVAPIGVLDAKLVGPARLNVTSANFSRRDASERALHGTQIVTLINDSGLLRTPRVFHADVVSPNARIGDTASVDSMLRGLNWLMGRNVRVINVSLAGPYNKILDRAFTNAERAGAVIVAPAGNAGPGQNVRYPAAFASTIAVTAVDANAQVYRNAVRGQRIDFSAPGVDIAIRLPARQTYATGTSFAAPFVTMRIAADPELARMTRVAAIRRQLSASVADLGAAGRDPVYGFGLIRAPQACSDA